MGRRIVITGATGRIGRQLSSRLIERGESLVVLSRDEAKAAATVPGAAAYVHYDGQAGGDWASAIDGADAVVHLAGAGVFGARQSRASVEAATDERVRHKPHRSRRSSTAASLCSWQGHRRRWALRYRPGGRRARSTRRPSSRRSGPSRCCRCGPGRSSGTPRLQAQRHDQPVRRARGRDRAGRPIQAASAHGRRLPGVPAAARPDLPGGEITSCSTTSAPTRRPTSSAWRAKHPRFTFPFTTKTSASWMNQVETWFGILTRQALRRGSVENVRVLGRRDRALHARVERRIPHPFTWVKPADEILAKAVRKIELTAGGPREPKH